MRPADVDRSGDVWRYTPAEHKTEHQGKRRVVAIAPRAQAILLPYLLRDAESFCFCPILSEHQRRRDQREDGQAAPMTVADELTRWQLGVVLEKSPDPGQFEPW